MIKTKQIVDGKWVYAESDRKLQTGDKIEFTCNGKGRGGHYHVTAIVYEVKPKTIKAIEFERSYSPGTKWSMSRDAEMVVVL